MSPPSGTRKHFGVTGDRAACFHVLAHMREKDNFTSISPATGSLIVYRPSCSSRMAHVGSLSVLRVEKTFDMGVQDPGPNQCSELPEMRQSARRFKPGNSFSLGEIPKHRPLPAAGLEFSSSRKQSAPYRKTRGKTDGLLSFSVQKTEQILNKTASCENTWHGWASVVHFSKMKKGDIAETGILCIQPSFFFPPPSRLSPTSKSDGFQCEGSIERHGESLVPLPERSFSRFHIAEACSFREGVSYFIPQPRREHTQIVLMVSLAKETSTKVWLMNRDRAIRKVIDGRSPSGSDYRGCGGSFSAGRRDGRTVV
ncbi:hypothetical protein H6P81_021749 [Aristolochia fimbriata]|uniref:Uncharacterized protein n=1 Tax=Aristolochia fimbriata TaxID=158543 RepID=A0AAV7DP19_ARIFI|nr:hypothetical protein H6P81_021749 [Aristolochia fimbriata]